MTGENLQRAARRRETKFKAGLMAVALGLAAACGGAVFAIRSATPFEGPAAFVGGFGLGLALVGTIASWVFRPTEASRRAMSAGAYRDRVQSERISLIMVLPASTLGLTLIAMTRADEFLSGEDRSWSGMLLAAVAALNILLLPLMVMGWDRQAQKMKRFLNDELTRTYRASAMTCAFWMLLVGVTGAYLAGLWYPHAAIVALPMILWVAAATAALRFAQLHRRAERDMEADD